MDEDVHVIIVLGTPFLATAGAIIDVKNENENIVFHFHETLRYPSSSFRDDFMRIDTIRHIINASTCGKKWI